MTDQEQQVEGQRVTSEQPLSTARDVNEDVELSPTKTAKLDEKKTDQENDVKAEESDGVATL